VIKRSEIKKIVSGYADIRIGVLGSHSALEIMDGAKDEEMSTIVWCQKGREEPYKRFKRLADEIIILNKFNEMLYPKVQKFLRDTGTIIIPHRSLTAYLGYKSIENSFKVPIFGNRALFQAEERSHKKNQYYLLEKARIKHPRIFKNPKNINKPAIVKVQEKKRKLERAFFTVSSYSDFKKKSENKIKRGLISKKDLENSSIEELSIGTYMNFNYFHTPISKQVDFIGIERRKLVLMVRETPLSAINIENMLKLARLGIVILPPVTEFYTKPKTIDDIVNHGVGKCLDQFGIDHDLYPRWGMS